MSISVKILRSIGIISFHRFIVSYVSYVLWDIILEIITY
jgi:hypothetical protein